MTRNEMIATLAVRTGVMMKDVEKVINGTLELIKKEVASGNRVVLLGFGTFSLSAKQERKGRDPRTGEEITIPAHKTPVFKPSKSFKALAND